MKKINSIAITLLLSSGLFAMEETSYKSVDGKDLKIAAWKQPDNAGKKFPAIIFFHGGAWKGQPDSLWRFKDHCEFLNKHGLVTFTAQYRYRNDGNAVAKAVADARSAVRWLRKNAEEFQIDPNRIIVSGGSAGGHLALCTAFADKAYDDPQDDASISCAPNALILFNPVIDTTETGFGKKLLGKDYQALSPIHNVNGDLPPVFIMHGEKDQIIKIDRIKAFEKIYQDKGGKITLKVYPRQHHGFFNKSVMGGRYHVVTMNDMADYLFKQGFIKQQPERLKLASKAKDIKKQVTPNTQGKADSSLAENIQGFKGKVSAIVKWGPKNGRYVMAKINSITPGEKSAAKDPNIMVGKEVKIASRWKNSQPIDTGYFKALKGGTEISQPVKFYKFHGLVPVFMLTADPSKK